MYADAIKAIVERRNIRWLIHFTHINNLLSILDRGIIPRQQLECDMLFYGTDYIFPDSVRVDEKTDRSCLSIMSPNNKMLWHKRKQYPDKEWVFLRLKPSILWEKPCLFYPTNAASNTVRFCDKSLFATPEALEKLFSGQRDCFPTDVQAEIMVEGVIEPSYIDICDLHPTQQSDFAQKLTLRFYPNIRFQYTCEFLCDFREDIN